MTARTLHRVRLAALLLLPALAAFPRPALAQAATTVWGSYLGGAGTETISAIAQSPVDGSVVVVGSTTSQDFPPRTTSGTLTTTDGFVHTFSANGAHGFGRVFGGATAQDGASAVGIGPSGLIFVGGLTATSSYPEFSQNIYLAYKGAEDGFLACFGADGTPLWFLYLGTTGLDFVTEIAVSGTDVYVAGYTNSGSTFLGGGGTALGGADGFVVKVDTSSGAPNILWHTLISGNVDDFPLSIALDGAGGVLVAGYSTSSVFPASMTPPHGGRDGLVAKLDAASGNLLWVNLLGSADNDEGRGIISAPNGQIVVAGVTTGALSKDAFVSRLDSGGHELKMDTFGGAGDDDVTSITSDAAGNLYISGSTNSPDFPLDKAFDQSLESGTSAREGFVVMLPEAGSSKLGWASYLGGNGADILNGVSIRSGSRLVVAGQTSSNMDLIPSSPFTYDATLAPPPDAFLMALDVADITPPIKGSVYDRPQEDMIPLDVANQTSTNSLAANWEAFTDFDSTIVGYECGFGTAPGRDDVSPFTPNTPPLKQTCSAQRFLSPGQTYYVTVRATSSAGLTATASSNGVRVGEAPGPDGGTGGGTDGGTDGGTEEPTPPTHDKALLGFSCTAAEAGPPMLVGLLALIMLARRRDSSSR